METGAASFLNIFFLKEGIDFFYQIFWLHT